MNVTVYLGAKMGHDPKFRRKAEELGEYIGKHGFNLVYGGSDEGLMGKLADAVLRTGARVTGVEPQFFVDQEVQHHGIDELIVVETMSERKQKMMELGDVFIAFPGGLGTLDELAEIMDLIKIKRLDSTIILYNIDGFYDPLKLMLNNMIKEGFLRENELENILFYTSIDEVESFLKNYSERRGL